MARRTPRIYSRYSREALCLLGGLIRAARIQRQIGTQDLADRAGISRDMLHRIEKGDPRCEIGVVFELATLLGVPLFAPELGALQAHRRENEARLTLLPKTVHTSGEGVKDDF